MVQLLFSSGLFLSASLLFIIQPMVAKALLPVYGGTPAVWTVCMLFFQVLLLLSYGYAYLLSKINDIWLWRSSHFALMLISLLNLPLMFSPSIKNAVPELSILGNLLLQLGFPLLVVGASAPLLQFAYSQTRGKKASDPYFLYVASNIGSLLALLAYPWLIERYIGLKLQFYYWTWGYCVFLLLLFIIFLAFYYQPLSQVYTRFKLSWSQVLKWVTYSFIPCSLLLGVSFYISTDVAPTPLLWTIPLALYLLTFIITFAKRSIISFDWLKQQVLFFFIFPVLGFIIGGNNISVSQIVIFHLLNFFVLSLLCHQQLVELRPVPNQLTLFYFCLALGGVLAGIFNGLIAPRLFSGIYEYPLVLALALLCIPLKEERGFTYMPLLILILLALNYYLMDGEVFHLLKQYHVIEILSLILIVLWSGNRLNLFLGFSILFIFLFFPAFQNKDVLLQERNFYGIKQVSKVAGAYALMSHNTLHGFQMPDKDHLNGGVAYYGPMQGVVSLLREDKNTLTANIIGLGTGTAVCQFQKGDQVQIIDIDEQVIKIANNPRWFSYLRDCPAKASIIKGDGRMALRQVVNASADLLALDAFSSDAIPTHLLTLEAFKLYAQKISSDGVILVHISNRNLDFLPVLTAVGRQLDLIVLKKHQQENLLEKQLASDWVALTMNQPLAVKLMQKGGWHFVSMENQQLWTDDYSNLIPLLK
ncbi:spermidine synthase [Legionella jordanis]|uniref:Spermidine synthase n=1 Tax=Legionella jordanis TaxID=456 RepID=A0A0W0V8Y2_9GAMM|nr:fused MFS/spermidine synthase [Legionella jordanis]KTD16536.1 spermidine synthase [Legionella jordanis]RMX03922.1 spermidine synthase [Legionella jordanis]VEH12002.1 spermidine synthase [Legionella jordanis]HAT8712694.1 spermidine synthase [Legionella jordanis]